MDSTVEQEGLGASEMNQRKFLKLFEELFEIKNPIFVYQWDTPEDRLLWAKDVKDTIVLGRYRIDDELWIDLDGRDDTPFKKLKDAQLKLIHTLKWFGIPEDCIYVKSSGRGLHTHVFTEGFRSQGQLLQALKAILIKSEIPKKEEHDDKIPVGLDFARILATRTKIREFGASNGDHYCTLVDIKKLRKKKSYPKVTSPRSVVYPDIKSFKITKEFIRKVHEIEIEEMVAEFEKGGEVDFDRFGNVTDLYKCAAVKSLAEKTQAQHHLSNPERVFISQVFAYFGETGTQEIHNILSECTDYDESYTQKQIDSLKRIGRKPVTCRWARERGLCPKDCKGSGGRSPIKFAYGPMKRTMVYEAIEEYMALDRLDGKKDYELLDVIFASAIDRCMVGKPLWMLLVAPSGGSKNTILELLIKYHKVLFLSELTPKSFISGMKPEEKLGILWDLDGRLLVIKDFTVLLSKSREIRDEVFGTLRDCYDGSFDKAFGTVRGKISVKALFSLIAGVTPVIDNYWVVLVILGERFLKVRSNFDEDSILRAIMERGEEDLNAQLEKLQKMVARWLKNIDSSKRIDIPKKYWSTIMKLVQFVATARTPLWSKGREGNFVGTREYASRLILQGKRLMQLLCYIREKKEITTEELHTLARVMFQTIPRERMNVIAYLVAHGSEGKGVSEIAKATFTGDYECHKNLEQLKVLGIVTRNDATTHYEIAERYVDWLLQWAKIHGNLWTSYSVVGYKGKSMIRKKDKPLVLPRLTLPLEKQQVLKIDAENIREVCPHIGILHPKEFHCADCDDTAEACNCFDCMGVFCDACGSFVWFRRKRDGRVSSANCQDVVDAYHDFHEQFRRLVIVEECSLPPRCGFCGQDGFPQCDFFAYCVYEELIEWAMKKNK